MDDLISRQAAIDALNGIINRFEQILRDIRESKIDDSVCGMCEYDGAFVGQSGDWCNECPGFEKDDCFKLSDKCRKRWLESVKLPSAQQWISCSERCPEQSGWYLVSLKNGNVQKAWYRVAQINQGGSYWRSPIKRPLAWMPLPEPWKGEEHVTSRAVLSQKPVR